MTTQPTNPPKPAEKAVLVFCQDELLIKNIAQQVSQQAGHTVKAVISSAHNAHELKGQPS